MSRRLLLSVLALAFALLLSGPAAAALLVTTTGKEFEVDLLDRDATGLIVNYKGERAFVRWENIRWVSGPAVFTMKNGKSMVFYAVNTTDDGWIVRPLWVKEGGEFEIVNSLVQKVETPLEIEREYWQRRARSDFNDVRQQFDLLKWCIAKGRDDLAVAHARALRETHNAWNLAVLMQAALVGMPRSEIAAPGTPERERAILQTLYRAVVESRDAQHVASVGYAVAAFDLASGQIVTQDSAVRDYLDTLYAFAENVTKARTEYEHALENKKHMVQCPKCKGTGKVRGRYLGRVANEKLGNLLSDGQALDIKEGFEIIGCDRCGGTGQVSEINELPQGPAGVKAALSPALWTALRDSVNRYLDASVPEALTGITVRQKG